jgi:hypothetical protein
MASPRVRIFPLAQPCGCLPRASKSSAVLPRQIPSLEYAMSHAGRKLVQVVEEMMHVSIEIGES